MTYLGSIEYAIIFIESYIYVYLGQLVTGECSAYTKRHVYKLRLHSTVLKKPSFLDYTQILTKCSTEVTDQVFNAEELHMNELDSKNQAHIKKRPLIRQ